MAANHQLPYDLEALVKSIPSLDNLLSQICVAELEANLVLKYQELFGYTAKTWITDQDARLDERYISFDVPEFRLGVGKLLDVPYLAIAKVRDEDYSKIYSLKTMRKRELLFTMPTPLAGDIHTLVVSQVATMEFARDVLKLPVPKVLAYSKTGDQIAHDAVAEFFLIDKPDGRPLKDIWNYLDEKRKFALIEKVAILEAKMARASFPKHGGIYYKADCPDGTPLDPLDFVGYDGDITKFVIGPMIPRSFMSGERRSLRVDRGPWSSAEAYLQAIIAAEVAWLTREGAEETDEDDKLLNGHPVIDPKAHIDILDKTSAIIPHIVPNNEAFTRPTLRHGDLSLENIYVNIKTLEIVAIIDWQTASIGPLFTHFKFASFVDCEDTYVWGTYAPKVKDDAPQEKRLRIKKFYEMMSRKHNPEIAMVLDTMRNNHHLEDPTTYLFQVLTTMLQWNDVPTLALKTLVMDTVQEWDLIREWRGVPKGLCPLTYTEEEVAEVIELSKKFAKAADEFDAVKALLPIEKDGRVAVKKLAKAKALFAKHKQALIDHRRVLEALASQA